MKDEHETQEQLINELVELRQRIAEVEVSESARKRAEEALRESEQHYRQLFQGVGDAVMVYSSQGRFLDCNEATLQRLGYSREELLRLGAADIVLPDFHLVMKENQKRIWAGEITVVESAHSCKDGRVIPVEVNARRIKYQGEWAILAVVRDITERVRAEEALRESEERFRELFNNMSSGVAVYEAIDDGRDFIIADINRAGEQIGRVQRDEVIGKSVLKVFPGVRDFGLFDVLQQVWRTCRPVHHPAAVYEDNRLSHWADNYVYKLPSGAVVAVYDDITKRKRAEEELRKHREHLEELVEERTSEVEEKTAQLEQANIRLQETDRLKSVFLASMSHELRTPLNSIIGFTGIILMGMVGEISEEQRKQLTMVKNSANHLLSLINDLLDISRIEDGRVELSLEEFRLHDVVREVVETLSPAVSEKGLELLTEVPAGLTLFSDRRRMKEVLMNLLSNAVKFTDRGSVKIAARAFDEKLKMRVTDTGIGIKQEDMHKLFEPFQQLDMSLTKKRKGTGLGLHLTRELVTLLGGDISAKSEYGRGSEFTFTMPLQYGEEQR